MASGAVTATTPRGVWAAVVLVMGLVAPYLSAIAWVLNRGPFVDTTFEYDRLQSAVNTAEYLRLVALDNQPPGSMLMTWLVYTNFDSGFTSTRLILAGMAVTAVLAVGGWGLYKPTWLGPRCVGMGLGTAKWRLATGLFGLLVAISPAVVPVMSLLRYSTWMAVLWLASTILLLKLVVTPRRQYLVAAGIVSGLSMLVSFTGIALVLLVSGVVMVRCRRHFVLLLIGWIPSTVVLIGWIAWAGEEFVSRVLIKSGSSWLERITSGYENLSWLIVGPASLPAWPALLILVLGLSALLILLWRLPTWTRIVLLAGTMTAIGVFSFVTLVNGNMAGPTLALLLASAAVAATTPSRWIITSITVFTVTVGAAYALVWSNTSVLRPFYWSNAAGQAVKETQDARTFDSEIVINFGDGGVGLLLEEAGVSPIIGFPSDLSPLVRARSFVIIRGDEIDKNDTWESLQRDFISLGFECVSERGIAPYDFSSVRKLLGMYNVATPQYRIYRYERVDQQGAQEFQLACD